MNDDIQYRILNDNKEVVVTDQAGWAEWMKNRDKPGFAYLVTHDEPALGVKVSTIFLPGPFVEDSHPFETAIINDGGIEPQARYHTYTQAMEGHKRYCRIALNDLARKYRD